MNTPHRQASVLVVDDEVGVRESIADILSDQGYKVLVASCGEEAEQQIVKNSIDLAVLDVWMPPGIDGVTLLRRWRDGGLLEFPVIMISAHATLDAAIEAMSIGAKDFLEKPFSTQRLTGTVRKVLASKPDPTFDSSRIKTHFGSSSFMINLKGKLLHATKQAGCVIFVGESGGACEFFARFLQNTGRNWIVSEDLSLLEQDPLEILSSAANGHLYLRGLDNLNTAGQRGLLLLLANAPSKNTRILCEFATKPKELHAAGIISAELHRALGESIVVIPKLAEFSNDLPELITLAAKHLTLRESLPQKSLSLSEVNNLANQIAHWSSEDGFARLFEKLRAEVLSVGKTTSTAKTRLSSSRADPSESTSTPSDDLYELPLREAKKKFEQRYYDKLLQRADGNYRVAAKFAGLERTYLYQRVQGLLRPASRPAKKTSANQPTGK